MLDIKVQLLYKLSPSQLDAFAKLQKPMFHSSPQPRDISDPINRNLYAIGATIDDKPVGLILSVLSQQEKAAEIVSFYVDEAYRKQDIASYLIEYMAQQLKSLDFRAIAIAYPDRTPETPAIENFLHKNGFSGKKMVLAEFMFDYSHFAPPWFIKKYVWPKEFQVFPWTELTLEEINLINTKFTNRYIPNVVYPFLGDSSFDPLNSLGLRHRGEVIGWVLTKRVQPEILCYENLYIDQEYQHKGYSIQLLVDSIRIHVENEVKWGLFKVNINEASARWLKFIRQRLAPYADHIYEYYQAFRPL